MLETILDRHVVFVLLGILAFAGVVSKCVVNISLKRLVRAAGNMNKSTHPLMRLVRAKFEHASMISDKVENVRVFVDKYLYEYRVLGIRLHGWRRMEKAAAVLCLLAGAAGAGLAYYVNGMDHMVWKIGASGAGLAAFVYLVHLMTDERYQLEAVRNYMVDYLENVCLHKYEKSNQKEIKVLTQEGFSPEFGVMPADSGYEIDARNPGRGMDTGDRSQNPGTEERDRNSGRGMDMGDRSAVNIFHAAELAEEALGAIQDDEPLRDEAVEAFRRAEPARNKTKEMYPAAAANWDEGAEVNRTSGGIRDEETEKYRAFGGDRGGEMEMYQAGRGVREENEGAVRRSEPVCGEAAEVFFQSELARNEAVNAVRKAEPGRKEVGQASEEGRQRTQGAGRAAELIRNESQGTSRAAELIRNESLGSVRMERMRGDSVELELEKPEARDTVKENIVEIPAPEYAVGGTEPVVIEPPKKSKASVRNASQRQMPSKERGTHRERAESEPDRDVVIRRILEEFMA